MTTKTHSTEAVYRAENALCHIIDHSGEAPLIEIHGSSVMIPAERNFGSIVSVQRYVDGVLALHWVQAQFPRAALPVTVRLRRGAAKAHYEHSGNVIAIPMEPHASVRSWAMREVVVLHELAHHMVGAPHGHDAFFVESFVNLIGGVMGFEADFLLRTLFYDEGVQVG